MGFSLYLPADRVRRSHTNPVLHRLPCWRFHQNTVNTGAEKDHPAKMPGTSDPPFHV